MSDLSTLLNQRINALRSIASNPQVAIGLVELGKNVEADLDQYVQLITLDPALSARMLSAVNSAWFAPRHSITTIKRAVGMLGVNNARALGVSFCLSSLHAALRLEPGDCKALWEASMCKAVAARRLAGLRSLKCEEEAFAAGLLQDVAVGVFASVDPSYLEYLRDPTHGAKERLKHERETYGNDHARAGRLIGDRLGLPPFYLDLIASHHDGAGLDASDPQPAAPRRRAEDASGDGLIVTLASYIVSFLPHDIRSWSPEDASHLERVLAQHYPGHWANAAAFFGEIQSEFDETCDVLTQGDHKPRPLRELIEEVSNEVSDNAVELVGQLQSVVSSHTNLCGVVNQLSEMHAAAQERADHDPLTGTLNRSGFSRRAGQIAAAARISGDPLALAFFDLDNFKGINDSHGHDAGDEVLRAVAQRLRGTVRDHDIVCRWGGDEFVVLFSKLALSDCIEVARRTQQTVARDPVQVGATLLSLSISGGMAWTARILSDAELAELISQADQCLYEAKSRRGSLVCRERQARKVA